MYNIQGLDLRQMQEYFLRFSLSKLPKFLTKFCVEYKLELPSFGPRQLLSRN